MATSSGPDPVIPIVVINDTRADLHHGCSRVMRTLEILLAANGLKVIAAAPTHTDWRTDSNVMAALPYARLVVVNGEGTIHHDRPAGRRLLEVGAKARSLGVPAALINASWQANSAPLAAMLNDFAIVSVREQMSARDIEAAGGQCRVVPDLSLYLPVPDAPARQGVGFTDSVLRETALDLEAARKRLGGRPVPIQFSPPGLAGKLRFVREGVGKSDLARPGFLARTIAGRLTAHAAQIQGDEAYMARLAALDLLVTGRFHAATFALAAGTPLLAVESNTHKITATLTDAGISPWRVVAPGALTPQLLERARCWTSAEQASLAAWLTRGRAATETLFADLARLAG